MTGLQNPWDIAFTPDGAMLYTEKCRGLSARFANGTTVRLFGTAGSSLVASDLFCEGQSGVHGVAVDPDFANGNRYVYVFMASNLTTNPRTNRVVRLSLSADNMSASGRTDIITDIAYKDVGNGVGGAGAHSGGRLRFGPDRFLYVTTGDNHNATLPQDLQRLGGKVLRVDRNGVAAPGNNTPAGGDPRIFTYGHRNVQGITFRPAGQPNAGQPFTAEHGPNHSDEVTPLVAGGNAGWDPQNRAGLTCPRQLLRIRGKSDDDADDRHCALSGRDASKLDQQWRSRNGAGDVSLRHSVERMGRPSDGRNHGRPTNRRPSIGFCRHDHNNVTANLPSARSRALVQGPDGNLYVATDSGESGGSCQADLCQSSAIAGRCPRWRVDSYKPTPVLERFTQQAAPQWSRFT